MKIKLVMLTLLVAALAVPAFAQDLTIDYQFNIAADDPGNFFSFRGPIRYMAADRDTFDAATGASRQNSTEMFMPYLFDVKGRPVFPIGLRGILLYAVAPPVLRTVSPLTASRAPNGVITIQYVHRGTAFRMETDTAGRLAFPAGNFVRRTVGFIEGRGPQVIGSDFSADGTAARIDWRRVWDASIPSGREIRAGVAARTGAITDDNRAPDTFFHWAGTLQVTLEGSILRIRGGLTAAN